MEVTRRNFSAVLAQVRAAIADASYLCVDTEFTGLPSRRERGDVLDSIADRYRGLCTGVSRYAVLQFGLSAFCIDPGTGRVKYQTFNFFLFPRQSGGQSGVSSQAFLCLPSSLEFLEANGFDFNKTIREGIPHLRPDDEQRLKQWLENRAEQNYVEQAPSSAASAAPLPADGPCRQTFDRIIQMIREHFGKVANGQLTGEEEGKDKGADHDKNSPGDDVIDLVNLSAYQRKLLYDHAARLVSERIEMRTVQMSGDMKVLRVSLTPPGEKSENRLQRKLRGIQQELDEAAGFTRVIEAIASSGKPVVGHNLLYDILLIVHHYIEPLPEQYDDFKETVKRWFPRLLDTKLIGLMPPFKQLLPSTILIDMVESLSTSPFHLPDIECVGSSPYSLTDTKCHEAGYDTFLTGIALATMLRYLGSRQSPAVKTLPMTHQLVNVLTNRIYVSCMNEVLYIDLTGDDPVPCRDHVFHVTFPVSYRTSDLVKLFKPVGAVHVKWIDDTSAFVTLVRREKAGEVMMTVNSPAVALHTFADYKTSQKISESNVKSNRSQIDDVTASRRDVTPVKRQSSPSSSADSTVIGCDVSQRTTNKKSRNPSVSDAPVMDHTMSIDDEGEVIDDANITSSNTDCSNQLFQVPAKW